MRRGRFNRIIWQGAPRAFLRDGRGSTAIIFAYAALPMVLAVGMATDLRHAYAVKSQLSSAVDAAAIAAATQGNGDTPAQLTTLATQYLSANFSADKGVVLGATTIDTSVAAQLTVSTSAAVPTLFMKIAGYKSVTVNASSTVKYRPLSPIEVALVVNNTGYMAGPKDSLKYAAGQFVTQLFGAATSHNANVKVAIIPFLSAVNPVPGYIPNASTTPAAFAQTLISNAPTAPRDWPDYYTYSQPTVDYTPSPSTDANMWLGCVEESSAVKGLMQSNPDYTIMGPALDTAVTTANGAFTPYYWAAETGPDYGQCKFVTGDPALDAPGARSSGADPVGSCNTYTPMASPNPTVTQLRWGTTNSYFGPNRACPQPLTPLTNNLQPLYTAIGVNSDGSVKENAGFGSYYDSGVANYEGLAWAYRVLSPSGLYSNMSTISGWENGITQKYVVLFADGDNSWDEYYSAQGNYPWANGKPNDLLETQQKAVCDVLKSKGVAIYTLEYSANNTNHASYYCAGTKVGVTDPNYYFQPQNNTALINDFQIIANKLSQTLITR